MKITKEKVIARLVKGGFNKETATQATEEHFDYAVSTYNGIAKICDVIMTIETPQLFY